MAGMADRIVAQLDAQGSTARAFEELGVIRDEGVHARSGIETV